MMFLRGLKTNVKPLLAARAYSLAKLKAGIVNYKQVYEENWETTYELPMEWGSKKTSQEHPISNKIIDMPATATATVDQDQRSIVLVSRPRRRATLRSTDETRLAPS
ncbi:hypothetical protein EVAR_38300_1 [Eumeta japonica]|uniref:Uncharacterized protein n=1 Tax=Eumeta variegata TaxID=151549 RepID=A0A4C1W752_EUMVA|nr:hypothetical protein EVAR_38300_1 [Eumeta japonica]